MRQLVIITLLFSAYFCRAQQPYFYALNEEDGLPSNEVYQVIQDDFGFIWIGCDAGLYRYDGFNFKPYQCSQQNSKSISNLKKDQRGNIWCQNFSGQIFRTSDDSLLLIHDASEESRHFPSYTLDADNRLWIANDKSILILDDKGKEVKKLESQNLHPSECSFNDIEFSSDQKIYAGTNLGANIQVDPINFKTRFIEDPNTFSIKNNFLLLNQKLFQMKEINPERKYFLKEIKENGLGEEIELPLKEGGFNYFLAFINRQYFLCTSDGIYILNRQGKRVLSEPVLFEGRKISHCFLDKEGNLWVTSLQDGIFVIPDLSIKVVNKENSPLSDNHVSALFAADETTIYAGTYSGLIYAYDLEKKQIQSLTEKSENKYRAVRKILSKDESLYLARGLFCIIKGDQETVLPQLNNSRDFHLQDQKIFYITNDRLGFYDLQEKKNQLLREKGGRKLFFDEKNEIAYFACDDGFFQYRNGILTELQYQNKPLFISDISFENGTLWLATHQHEIFCYSDGKFRQWKHDKEENAGGIKSILVKENHLLFSDGNGLTIYHLTDKKKRKINFYDGLAFHEINDILWKNDEIFLATLKGLVILPFEIKTENKIAPQITITSVSSDENSFNNLDEIEVNYGFQNLRIKFISTAFRSRGKFRYRYRITNYSDEWTEISSNSPEVTIPFLPSGDFIFEVVAVNEDGIPSDQPAKISIHVNAPYWEKWWFYALIFLLSSGIIAIIFIFRIRYLKQKAKAKNKVLLSQLTALKAQMNPHFLFNTLNSIQALVLEKDIKNANYYLSRFSTLTRKILAASDSNTISLEEEISILELYLEMEKLRFGEEFWYEIRHQADLQLEIPSMIIQPYVENALKHGLLHKKGEKKLSIFFEKEDNQLICKIDDNGVGREKAMEIKNRQQKSHTSFATQAIEKRIALLNESRFGKIELQIIDKREEEKASGTLIIIRIPIGS